MSKELPQDLLNQWKQEDLPQTRATGQILQHLVHVYQVIDDMHRERVTLVRRQTRLEERVLMLEQAVADLQRRLRGKM